jgi:hypothetical protein
LLHWSSFKARQELGRPIILVRVVRPVEAVLRTKQVSNPFASTINEDMGCRALVVSFTPKLDNTQPREKIKAVREMFSVIHVVMQPCPIVGMPISAWVSECKHSKMLSGEPFLIFCKKIVLRISKPS